jgi:hypothetical protein
VEIDFEYAHKSLAKSKMAKMAKNTKAEREWRRE